MHTSAHQTFWQVRISVTTGIGLITLSIIAGLVRYPTLLAESGAVVYLGLYAVVASGYLVIAWRASRPRSAERAIAIRGGIVWGGILSGLWLMEIITGNFGSTSVIKTMLYFGATWTAFLLPLLSGFWGARQTGRVQTGTLVGLWGGLVNGLSACLALSVIGLFFNTTIQHDPQTIHEFARSGTADIRAFIFGDFLAGGINHLWFVGPVLGSLTGTLGGFIGVQSGSLANRANEDLAQEIEHRQ